MNKVFLIIIVISITTIGGYSQSEINNVDSSVINEKDYLKGFHKPTDDEMENLRLELTTDISFYTEDGEKKSFNEIIPLLQSGDYTLDPYIDDKQELKVAVLRSTTDIEKQELKEMQGKMNETSEHVGSIARPFQVSDIDGNKYSMEELAGKIIVMNFWFVECKPCVIEIPELNRLVEKYKGEDVVFLGFATNDNSSIASFLKKKEFNYNIIPESMDVIRSYGIVAFPTHVVVDKKSKITFSVSGLGPTTISDLESEIEALLKE